MDCFWRHVHLPSQSGFNYGTDAVTAEKLFERTLDGICDMKACTFLSLRGVHVRPLLGYLAGPFTESMQNLIHDLLQSLHGEVTIDT